MTPLDEAIDACVDYLNNALVVRRVSHSSKALSYLKTTLYNCRSELARRDAEIAKLKKESVDE